MKVRLYKKLDEYSSTSEFRLSILVSVIEALFLLALGFIILVRGSVNPIASAFFSMVFGALGLMSTSLFGEPRQTAAAFRIAVAIVITLTLWIVIQSSGIPSFANPSWQDISRLALAQRQTISVAPTDSMAALCVLGLPFIVFLLVLSLFPSDKKAMQFLLLLEIFGGALAIWSICEFLLSPQTLLLGEKRDYLDSLTAPFVNRNTAATFYGLISLLSITGVYVDINQKILGDWPLRRRDTRDDKWVKFQILVRFVIYGSSLVALLLTKSRGGIGSTLAAYAVLLAIVLGVYGPSRRRTLSFIPSRPLLLQRFVRVVFAVIIVVISGAILSDRALFRADVQGLSDDRFCVAPAVLRAAHDNQLTGVGFGTFRLFFPAYRDARCGISGVWDRAHSFYLEGYLGLGVMFFIVLLTGIATLTWIYASGIRSRRSLRPYAVLGIAVLVLLLTHSVMDFSLQIPGLAAVSASVLAALTTVSRGRLGAPVDAQRAS